MGRVTLATALLAAGTSWNAGNIGPVPLLIIPVVGAALAEGNGEAALIALGAVCALGGIANFRPAVPPAPRR
jgi:hypothetical protein